MDDEKRENDVVKARWICPKCKESYSAHILRKWLDDFDLVCDSCNPPDPIRQAAEDCFEDVVGREPEPDNAMDQRAVGTLYQRLRALMERERERCHGIFKEYLSMKVDAQHPAAPDASGYLRRIRQGGK